MPLTVWHSAFNKFIPVTTWGHPFAICACTLFWPFQSALGTLRRPVALWSLATRYLIWWLSFKNDMDSKIRSWRNEIVSVSTFLSVGKLKHFTYAMLSSVSYVVRYFFTSLQTSISSTATHPLNGHLRDSNLPELKVQFGNMKASKQWSKLKGHTNFEGEVQIGMAYCPVTIPSPIGRWCLANCHSLPLS